MSQDSQQMVASIYRFAAQEMRTGRSDWEVTKMLEERGLDKQSANVIVQNLSAARTKAKRDAALRSMAIGALFCIGGIIVTAATYNAAASNPGGGRYVVAWGAVIFGGLQFFRGLMSLM
jgi:hypothetical protein